MEKFLTAAIGLGLLWFSSGWSQAQDSLSLSLAEALEIGVKQSYRVQAAAQQLSLARGRNLEAWSGLLPSVQVSENFLRSNDPVAVFGLKLKQGVFSQNDFALSALNQPAPFTNYSTVLQIQQPLINLDALFGKLAGNSAAQAAAGDWRRARQAAAYAIKGAYYTLIFSRAQRRSLTRALAATQAYRDEVEAAYQQGTVHRADLLEAEVRLAGLHVRLLSAQQNILDVSDALKLLLGVDRTGTIIPSDSLARPSLEERMLPAGQADRPDLQALRLRATAARRQLWASRSSWIPRLNGFATREWNAPTFPGRSTANWTVGVQLTWRVFDGLGNWGRARQAAAQAQLAHIALQEGQQRAGNEIAAARRALQTASRKIPVATSAWRQAQESWRLTAERFQQGLEKPSRLLEREAAETEAHLGLLQAVYQYWMAHSELEYAAGNFSRH